MTIIQGLQRNATSLEKLWRNFYFILVYSPHESHCYWDCYSTSQQWTIYYMDHQSERHKEVTRSTSQCATLVQRGELSIFCILFLSPICWLLFTTHTVAFTLTLTLFFFLTIAVSASIYSNLTSHSERIEYAINYSIFSPSHTHHATNNRGTMTI